MRVSGKIEPFILISDTIMHMDDDDPFDSVAKEVGESLIKTEQTLTSWCKNVEKLLKNNLKISKKNVLLDEFSSHQTDLKQLEWDIAELQGVFKNITKIA